MADKYFIILGGSKDQRPSIIAAKELGFKTIIFDRDKNAYCRNLTDFFFNISSRDWKKIKKKTFAIQRSNIRCNCSRFRHTSNCIQN